MILQLKTALQSRRRHFRLMMFIAIAAAAIVLGWNGSKASAANTLDQGTGPTHPSTIGGSNYIGQSFTAGMTGTMYELDLFVTQVSPPAGTTLIIEIHDGENPNGTLLGSRTLSYNEVLALPGSPGGKFTVTFRDGINVTAGNKYTIMIHSSPGTGQVTMHMFGTNVYSGGQSYYYGTFNSSYDLAFQTYVSDSYRSYIPSLIVPPIVSTYGQAAPFTATLMVDGEPLANKYVTFSVDGNAVGTFGTNASGVVNVNYLALLSAGTHTVNVSYAGAYPYYAASASTTLTVNKADLTVTVQPKTKVYGDNMPLATATYTGAVTGDLPAITGATVFTIGAGSATGVGTYPITASLGSSLSNYNVTYVPSTLEITPAPLSVTVQNDSRVYGTANPSFTASITGLKNSDSMTASFATAADVSSAVGGYAVTPSLNPVSGSLSNYAVTATPGTLTVTKASLSVAASDASRQYGAANPAFAGTLTGVVNGDNITASYTTAADASSSVGGYAITPQLNDPTSKLGNYDVTATPATLMVTQAPLNVAASNASRQYGAANPLFTGLLSGLRNGDAITASYTTTADASSLIGDYPIAPQLADPSGKLGNYTVTETPATLTVTKAPLAVTADDFARWLNEPNPSLTGTLTGTLATDGITVQYVTSTVQNSPVGTYPITPELDDPNHRLANYNVTTTPAVLTVYAKPAPAFAAGDSVASVTKNIQLPAVDEGGNTLNWTSADNSLLDPATGSIHRPSFTVGDKQVTLEASATVNHMAVSVSYVLTIKAAAMTDEEAVALDKGLLTIGYAATENESNVRSKVSLPAVGVNGSVITWASSEAGYVNPQTGAVQQPSNTSGDQRVTLTATITRGAVTETKVFQLTVLHDLSLIVQPDQPSGLYLDIVDSQGNSKRINISQADATAGTIHIDAGQADIGIEVSAEVVDKLRKINGAFKLLVTTPAGSITIPATAFDSKAIVRYTVHVGTAASQSMQAALAQQQVNVLAGPVAFQFATVNSKGLKIDKQAFQGKVTRSIVTDKTNLDSSAVVVRWDDKIQAFSYVPAQFQLADGKLIATFNSNETGVYLFVNRPVLFNDLVQHWAKEDAEWLASRFIIEGRSTGQFDPNSGLTRAETAALLVRALGISGMEADATFSDISGKWYEQAVALAAQAGLVTGYEDGTFRPNAKVTREELALMITRAIAYSGVNAQAAQGAQGGKLVDADSISAWAADAVQQVLDLGIVKGDPNGSFRPQDTATRAEMTVMLRRLLEALQYA
ncbi:MBG domain-containing protein [Paenibacillus sp. MMS18-CY102]|uniref:MBG domain-containing protein n=1 Tax=Paenibacillus sp. MMS18-CY102 TaxID=2682849 RepID=UPI001365DF7B|nr:MBG domain-containing protein [Paenibacillus sp. MMS18-CY102]MWC27726.1 hypothetical protein [Paenibacillus sp. MMS18-CY102]